MARSCVFVLLLCCALASFAAGHGSDSDQCLGYRQGYPLYYTCIIKCFQFVLGFNDSTANFCTSKFKLTKASKNEYTNVHAVNTLKCIAIKCKQFVPNEVCEDSSPDLGSSPDFSDFTTAFSTIFDDVATSEHSTWAPLLSGTTVEVTTSPELLSTPESRVDTPPSSITLGITSSSLSTDNWRVPTTPSPQADDASKTLPSIGEEQPSDSDECDDEDDGMDDDSWDGISTSAQRTENPYYLDEGCSSPDDNFSTSAASASSDRDNSSASDASDSGKGDDSSESAASDSSNEDNSSESAASDSSNEDDSSASAASDSSNEDDSSANDASDSSNEDDSSASAASDSSNEDDSSASAASDSSNEDDSSASAASDSSNEDDSSASAASASHKEDDTSASATSVVSNEGGSSASAVSDLDFFYDFVYDDEDELSNSTPSSNSSDVSKKNIISPTSEQPWQNTPHPPIGLTSSDSAELPDDASNDGTSFNDQISNNGFDADNAYYDYAGADSGAGQDESESYAFSDSQMGNNNLQVPQSLNLEPPDYSPQLAPDYNLQQPPDYNLQEAPDYNSPEAPDYNLQEAPDYNPQQAPAFSPQQAPSYNLQKAHVFNRHKAHVFNPQKSPSFNSQQAPAFNSQKATAYNTQQAPVYYSQQAPLYNSQQETAYDYPQETAYNPQQLPKWNNNNNNFANNFNYAQQNPRRQIPVQNKWKRRKQGLFQANNQENQWDEGNINNNRRQGNVANVQPGKNGGVWRKRRIPVSNVEY